MCANHRQEWGKDSRPKKTAPACPREPMPFHIYCRECFTALGGYFRRLR